MSGKQILQKTGIWFAETFRYYLPDPFAFAAVLTFIAGVGALLTGATAGEISAAWFKGTTSIFKFAFQMILILTTGYAVAISPAVSKGIRKLAVFIKTPAGVYFTVTLAGCIFSTISWGWVVITALLARELGKRVKGVDLAFLGACVYVSFLPWHGGLSGSIPLLLATPNNFLIRSGVLQETIPATQTLLSTLNLTVTLSLTAFLPFLMLLMYRTVKTTNPVTFKEEDPEHHRKEHTERALSFSEKLSASPVTTLLAALIPGIYLTIHFSSHGFDINLNVMILLFLTLGLILHGSLSDYFVAMKQAVSDIHGIVLLFPFYGGIMGIFAHTPLGHEVTRFLISLSTPETFPFIAFITGGIMNIPIPSGGGEWAVVGPVVVKASLKMGVPVWKAAMAVAYGDSLTNLIQPFWTLAFLPILGKGTPLSARDIMGFTALVCVIVFFIIGGFILIL